jgi:hypothetical protein
LRYAALAALVGAAALGAACVPSLPPPNPVPQQMDFDPTSLPPRVPQPTSLIYNTQTGHLDFSLAGLTLPADCINQESLSKAECLFDQWLQSLDGFPTVTPGTAPASAALDPTTFSPGHNVVAVAAVAENPVPGDQLILDFDAAGRNIDVRLKHWDVGEFYWLAVRGYKSGVKAADGSEVVSSATQFLLKQDDPLTCGATDAASIDPHCPAFALLSQTMSATDAFSSLAQLEPIRQAYAIGYKDISDWTLTPKSEVAELWGFPVASSSVAELDPKVGLVPQITAADEIHVAVAGTVDPATVTAFVPPSDPNGQYGSVVVMDLDNANALAANKPGVGIPDALPVVSAGYAGGDIVIKGKNPFTDGHQLGIFILRDTPNPMPGKGYPPGVRDAKGNPLIPSPVSKLLTFTVPLLDAANHSTISTVSDDDAMNLEGGRQQLGPLFDSQLAAFPGLTRDNAVYVYALAFKAPQ